MNDSSLVEVKLLMALLNEDDKEADRVMANMTENELITLKIISMRMTRYINDAIFERADKFKEDTTT